MCNVNALAIYGVEKNDVKDIYQMGLLFFDFLNLEINNAAYYKYREDRTEEDFDLIEVSMGELKHAIEAGEATSFRLYQGSRNGILWNASFGYSTEKFGGFYHIDAQAPSINFSQKKFIDYMDRFSRAASVDYAIYYPTNDVADALEYAAGENFLNLYSYEDSDLFCSETGGIYRGKERYKNRKLRMVYSVNVVNQEHLNIKVGECSLKEWILENAMRGSLIHGSNNLWFWLVESENLEIINRDLGLEGILISWQTPKSSKNSKRLP